MFRRFLHLIYDANHAQMCNKDDATVGSIAFAKDAGGNVVTCCSAEATPRRAGVPQPAGARGDRAVIELVRGRIDAHDQRGDRTAWRAQTLPAADLGVPCDRGDLGWVGEVDRRHPGTELGAAWTAAGSRA